MINTWRKSTNSLGQKCASSLRKLITRVLDFVVGTSFLRPQHDCYLKGLSHEIEFKYFDKTG
jgi:hypothetical protein